jgi:translation elongation factor EF-Tu-like GTPase
MFSMTVEDVFVIAGRGLVATGRVESGTLRVGEEVQLDGGVSARVDAIEKFRKTLDEAVAGENVGLLLSSLTKGQIGRGTVLTSGGASVGVTVNL